MHSLCENGCGHLTLKGRNYLITGNLKRTIAMLTLIEQFSYKILDVCMGKDNFRHDAQHPKRLQTDSPQGHHL